MRKQSERELLGFNGLQSGARRKPRQRVVKMAGRTASQQLTRRAWTALATLTAVFIAFPFAFRHHCEAWLLRRDLPSLQRQKMRAEQKHAELEMQIKFAQSRQGSESLAREYGFIKQGEVPFKIPGQDKINQNFDLPDRERLTLWDRVMYALCWITGAGSETVKAEDRQASNL